MVQLKTAETGRADRGQGWPVLSHNSRLGAAGGFGLTVSQSVRYNTFIGGGIRPMKIVIINLTSSQHTTFYQLHLQSELNVDLDSFMTISIHVEY